MDNHLEQLRKLKKRLMEIGVITTLVSIKLLLSTVIPGLKTTGELVWTALILSIYTVRIFLTYHKIEITEP